MASSGGPGSSTGPGRPTAWMAAAGVLGIAAAVLAGLLVWRWDGNGDAAGTTSSGPGWAATGPRAPTHEHADFAVVIRGERFDFGQPQFISDTEGKELSEHVHIHAPRFTVVHVHSTLVTWGEFFQSLGFKLTDPSFPGVTDERTCLELPSGEKLCNTASERWSFIANGVPVDGLATVNIGDLDRVLFSYGPETPEEALAKYWGLVTDQACIPSELCKARIPADEPPETCSGRGTCTR
ncbi:MAG: hypothetical protein KatS3mg064_1205 [Tepidiforma sp.]|nr:MAG: hypothetical protein KatS3mg064_1205 [Tepidiforma sp.]